MGTYFCQQNLPARDEIKSRQINEIHKSVNISAKQNSSTSKIYFSCDYLGKGVLGSTVEVFVKEKKEKRGDQEHRERFAQKIIRIDWIENNFLFTNAPLFRQFNYSIAFVHTFNLRVEMKKMYLVNEKLNLGNLYTFMKRYPKQLQYSVLKELAVRLLLILERLHNKGIIYRSLRPENILFTDTQGQFKLGQLPFCIVADHADNYIGAATYTPPQCYAQGQIKFDKSIDFWMLGVFFYELIMGVTPFEGQNLGQIKQKIVNFHHESLKFSQQTHVCQDLSDFVVTLLQPHPQMRLEINQLKRHKFFHGESLDDFRDDKQFLRIRPSDQIVDSTSPNRIVYSKIQKNKEFVPTFAQVIFDEICILNSV